MLKIAFSIVDSVLAAGGCDVVPVPVGRLFLHVHGMKLLFVVPAVFALVALVLPATVEAPFRMENIAESSGVQFTLENCATPQKHQVETMIAGVAVFDYDNDGLLDLYFVNGAKLPEMDKSDPRYWNRLYHNDGNGTFTDVTEKAGVTGQGYGMGCLGGRLRQRRLRGPVSSRRQLQPAPAQ